MPHNLTHTHTNAGKGIDTLLFATQMIQINLKIYTHKQQSVQYLHRYQYINPILNRNALTQINQSNKQWIITRPEAL